MNFFISNNKLLRETMARTQEYNKKMYDRKKRGELMLEPGSQVWLSTVNLKMTCPSRKLGPKFIGPFSVKRKINDVTYELDLPNTLKVHPVFHVSLLKPVTPNSFLGRNTGPPEPIIINNEEEERDGSQRPNCMICNAKLSNSSLAPAKLREHFLKLHGKYENTTLAEFKVKRARFNEKATLPVLGFVPINKPILTASYEVAYLIAKQGKPHIIAETLIKPAVLKMANIMLGKAAEVKLSQIPLSNDTISDRIEDMSKDILAQVVADLISSPAKFSLQLDETTDVSNLSQLAVFVRYVKDDVIKEDFLFCKPLTTTTKEADMKKLVDDFFKDNNLSWDMVSAACSDGAPAMLGSKVWFWHALATKTLPPKLAEVLKIVVECVNYVQNSALRHRIFRELCKEMGSEFEVLLYHSNVQGLSWGQVLNRVFAVRVELALFLQEHQHCHADCFKNSEFILILVYMADIFAALNHLNQQMQGGRVNIIEAEENLKAFQKKIPLWKRRIENDNFANFPLLDDCVSKIEDVSGIADISVPAELKQAIATHLDSLAKSLNGYFPTRESYPAWMRQPFTFSVETTDVNDEYLDEIIEIQQSQVQQQLFRTTTLSTFWCQQMVTYPVIVKKALEIFIPFVTTYLCEQSFEDAGHKNEEKEQTFLRK
ncbi:protein FAM200C-like [Aquarana catesbeiana]|uniref:protein FAM200C-like n=1 Tax=Aquarana catesbeiana TaxID=8400 RepID=UPI003CC95F5C